MPPVNYPTLSIAFSVVEGLAVILTLFRLGFRLKIQRFWWEDVWAAVASVCTVVSIVCVLIVSESSKCFPDPKPRLTPSTDFHLVTDYDKSTFVAGRINEYMLTSIVWSVRMSIIFSIIRITSSPLLRRITFATAACFLLFWLATFGLQSWWCLCDTAPMSPKHKQDCVVPRFIPIVEVATNVVADVVTVMLSLKLLWRVKLPVRQSRMILYLFTASRFLCAFSVAHAIAQLVSAQRTQEILACLQVTAFMIVCNLVVVVTYIYRVYWKSPANVNLSPGIENVLDDDDFTEPTARQMQSLTTVNLDSTFSSLAENAGDLGSDCAYSTRGTVTVS